ncbi:hypothetical protein CEXT_316041 [Caerostris extrusa]|uniref:Uncharacterized protein n=1 Tax=Caerostris extrusa TaxID=172846 RepID=A0AAV4WET6_CAEEX|nr:hypothetical protein CEXT_316041 [Caerostris extrusa]
MVRTKDGGSRADTLLAVRTTSAINRCPGDDLKTYGRMGFHFRLHHRFHALQQQLLLHSNVFRSTACQPVIENNR